MFSAQRGCDMNAHTTKPSTAQLIELTPVVNVIDVYSGIKQKSEAVIEHILDLFKAGKSVSVATSMGKDSSCVLVLALEAFKRAKAEGIYVRGFYVTHSNTGIENPAMGYYCDRMIEYVEQFIESNDLAGPNVKVMVARPELTASFVYATIGRGRMPVFANSGRRSCSVDWKVKPQQKLLKEVLKSAGGSENHVVLIGTRSSESKDRNTRMAVRGETATSIVKDSNGYNTNAPIADWDVMDVWTFLMSIDSSRGNATYETYVKDFEWTLELYKDANEGVCVVIVGEGGSKAPCSTRFGCGFCTVVAKDKSLESLIDNNQDAYGYMKGINAFRNYLIATRNDMSKRTVFGQTISAAGYINCRPDNYNIKMRQELLSYLITLDVEERERAENHTEDYYAGNIEKTTTNERLCDPQFEFVTAEMLVAIDFIWSLQCVGDTAFPAMQIWYNINHLGRRNSVPVITEPKNDKVPAKRYLFVGDTETLDGNDGLRDIYAEATNPRRGLNAFQAYTDSAGIERRVGLHHTAKSMTIDKEEAASFLFCEYEEIFWETYNSVSSRASLNMLLRRGLVKIAKGKIALYDNMARRYQHLKQLMLTHDQFDSEGKLYRETISNAEHDEILAGMDIEPGNEFLEIDAPLMNSDHDDQLALTF